MKLVSVIFRTFKGIYDILATYLLAFILPFALAALGLHFVAGTVAAWLEYTSAADMWDAASRTTGVADAYLRLAAMLPAHVVLFFGLRRPRKWAQPYVERAFDSVVQVFLKVTRPFPGARAFGEFAFSLVVTLLLIPFVWQPTLVHDTDARSWVERTANLLDGTASAELIDSVVGLYRQIYAEPVVAEGVTYEELEKVLEQIDDNGEPTLPPLAGGKEPLMDRWDPYIVAVAGGELDQYAYIKAFMWVESAGRQFAVSHTGCAGLMQFCSGTAKSEPYREIFGRGQVYTCGCRTKDCRVPREVQKDLESVDPNAINRQKDRFPCEITDARFNPKKAIMAGGTYVSRLRQAYGGNIYLMYIGYNSGPAVANKVWRAVGRKPGATLQEIEFHLPAAMMPHYGAGSKRRAASLVKNHLPKLKKAFERYKSNGLPDSVTSTPADAPAVEPATPAPDAGMDLDGADAVLAPRPFDGLVPS